MSTTPIATPVEGIGYQPDDISAAAVTVALEYGPIIPISIYPETTVTPTGPEIKWKKKPRFRNWQNDATQSPGMIDAWFTGASANTTGVGVITGLRSGLVVIDVDPRNGGTVKALEEALGTTLPRTRVHKTVSDGEHWFYVIPEGVEGVRSRLLVPGVELKADGCFVAIPPSPGYSITDAALFALAPPELLTYEHNAAQGGSADQNSPLRRIGTLHQTESYDNPRAYALSALEGMCADIVNCEKNRNDLLAKKAFRAAGYVAAGHITEDEYWLYLSDAARDAGQSEEELTDTLKYNLKKGMAHPLHLRQTSVMPSANR